MQQVLEAALGRVADQPVTVICAGRTDTGVHARGQVVHFDTPTVRSERAWVLGANTNLVDGVSVLWARPGPDGFHARFSARARTYQYRILNRWTRPGLAAGAVAWERRSLDAVRMHEASQALIGEHDFSSFRALGCQARHALRALHSLNVERRGDEIVIEVTANAFLYHMVRIIAGTLIEIGAGARPVGWMDEVLIARRRSAAGPTAPAEGLYFQSVAYPAYPGIPAGAAPAFPRGWNLS